MYEPPILICYDGSENAQRGIAAASALLGPRRAVVLDIGPPLTAAESYAAISPGAVGAEFEEFNTADALTRATEGAERAREAGFEATARGGIAAPTWQGVVDVADELDAAVIVLGSRGLKGGRELLEGSLSHQIAQNAGRPVLIVPPPK